MGSGWQRRVRGLGGGPQCVEGAGSGIPVWGRSGWVVVVSCTGEEGWRGGVCVGDPCPRVGSAWGDGRGFSAAGRPGWAIPTCGGMAACGAPGGSGRGDPVRGTSGSETGRPQSGGNPQGGGGGRPRTARGGLGGKPRPRAFNGRGGRQTRRTCGAASSRPPSLPARPPAPRRHRLAPAPSPPPRSARLGPARSAAPHGKSRPGSARRRRRGGLGRTGACPRPAR